MRHKQIMKRLLLALCLIAAPLCAREDFFYAGVEGGLVTGLSQATLKRNTGSVFADVATNAIPRAGFEVGASFGYKLPCLWRTEVAYAFHRQSYEWIIIATTPGAGFNAKLQSHLLMWNNYLHLRDIYRCPQSISNIDPYLSGGIGAAWNTFKEASEYQANSIEIATFDSRTTSQFAFSLGVGFLAYSSQMWIIDTFFRATYIGEVRTPGTRNFTLVSGTQPVGAYRFENNWIGTFGVSLKFGCRR